jgi:hypothetical protein
MSVVFISGHRNITEQEFEWHYKSKIFNAVSEGHTFVVGDCLGVDFMAQKYIASLGCEKVTVYHISGFPMNFYSMNFDLKGHFKSDVDRDWAMTMASDEDLAWVREGDERSGTAQNLYRRQLKADGVTSIMEVMTLEAGMWL